MVAVGSVDDIFRLLFRGSVKGIEGGAHAIDNILARYGDDALKALNEGNLETWLDDVSRNADNLDEPTKLALRNPAFKTAMRELSPQKAFLKEFKESCRTANAYGTDIDMTKMLAKHGISETDDVALRAKEIAQRMATDGRSLRSEAYSGRWVGGGKIYRFLDGQARYHDSSALRTVAELQRYLSSKWVLIPGFFGLHLATGGKSTEMTAAAAKEVGVKIYHSIEAVMPEFAALIKKNAPEIAHAVFKIIELPMDATKQALIGFGTDPKTADVAANIAWQNPLLTMLELTTRKDLSGTAIIERYEAAKLHPDGVDGYLAEQLHLPPEQVAAWNRKIMETRKANADGGVSTDLSPQSLQALIEQIKGGNIRETLETAVDKAQEKAGAKMEDVKEGVKKGALGKVWDGVTDLADDPMVRFGAIGGLVFTLMNFVAGTGFRTSALVAGLVATLFGPLLDPVITPLFNKISGADKQKPEQSLDASKSDLASSAEEPEDEKATMGRAQRHEIEHGRHTPIELRTASANGNQDWLFQGKGPRFDGMPEPRLSPEMTMG